MIELERRALLGDRQAQEECTRQGILLPCPFCGHDGTDYGFCTGTLKGFNYMKCENCGCEITVHESEYLGEAWNTRPAPPVGRCKECVAYVDSKCANTGYYKPDTGFCNDFAPKEAEEK